MIKKQTLLFGDCQKECNRIKATLLHNKGWFLAKIAESGSSSRYLSDEQTQRLIQHLCDVTYLHPHQIIAYIKKTFGINYSIPGINK